LLDRVLRNTRKKSRTENELHKTSGKKTIVAIKGGNRWIDIMNKQILERYKDKKVIITLRPNDIAIRGMILAIFDDCVEFQSDTETSYLTFEKITSIRDNGGY